MKVSCILSLTILLFAIGCSSQTTKDIANNNSQLQQEELSVSVNEIALIKNIAMNGLSEETKSTILTWKKPTVMKVEASSTPIKIEANHSKYFYKVTFNTTQDELLGPLSVYVDPVQKEIVGYDVRH